ncbi:MAG: S49 family peptidase [Rhodobacteraceae bacterium]|nr:S49 family peptidase [Paracoccaceae bacterium]
MKNPLKLFSPGASVSVLRLSGAIGGGRSAMNDAGLADLIEKAFTKGKPKAVALAINCPGGSPAQSALITARIRRLADEKSIPVYAFCEDVAASGGYWLATAADEIYVDDNSIMGSIGVISASFGFHEFMQKQGVERRVHTAGIDKSMLDPFRPERAEDIVRLKDLQKQIHDNFIAQVVMRRGEKLKGENLFTGEVWIGQKSVDNGLTDGVAHLVPKMKALFGDKVKFRSFGAKKSFMSKITGSVLTQLEDRALWARFGL